MITYEFVVADFKFMIALPLYFLEQMGLHLYKRFLENKPMN